MKEPVNLPKQLTDFVQMQLVCKAIVSSWETVVPATQDISFCWFYDTEFKVRIVNGKFLELITIEKDKMN